MLILLKQTFTPPLQFLAHYIFWGGKRIGGSSRSWTPPACSVLGSHRSQKAAGLFTKCSTVLKESQPASQTKDASAKDLKTGEELAQMRMCWIPGQGMFSSSKTQQLQYL